MREDCSLNLGWKFHLGDVDNGQDGVFDDSDWISVAVPHDWSIAEPFDSQWASATGYLPGGIGWYRRELDLTTLSDNQRCFVYFDGVYCCSDVWINGHHLGNRPNGFVSFEYELTDFIHRDQPNVLAVRVDHSKFADSRWYTGSGINRNVKLVITEAVHVANWGVFAISEHVTPEGARMNVRASVVNQSLIQANGSVDVSLFSSAGECAANTTASLQISAGDTSEIGLSFTVAEPELWSPDNPNLYMLVTTVAVDGVATDITAIPIGIRSIRFDSQEGFFLNGSNIKLKGVCVHDDAGVLGTAVPAKVWERRLQTLKAAGVNAIRMSHNPHAEEVYHLCDTLGLLVQDEAFDEWEGGKNKWIDGWNVGVPGHDGYNEHFAAWGERDLRDMILRGRNHPSIIMWSIGNEIDYPNDPYSHPILDHGTNPQSYGWGYKPEKPHADRLGEVARLLVAQVKKLDTTRPTTAGLAAALISNETGCAEALDVVGYNYQEFRYNTDHERFPNRVLYGSENGMKWPMWQAVLDNPRICGQFLWTGIDYLGEAHGWPLRSNGAGLLDLAGLPKPEFYFRQSIWTSEPMVYIGTSLIPKGDEQTSLWSHRSAEPVWKGSPGDPLRLVCFTNCERVELKINDRSHGVLNLCDFSDHDVFWDVSYEEGTVEVTGFNGEQEVARHFLVSTGEPAAVMVSVLDAHLTANGVDIAHILIHVVDALGQPVYDAVNEVQISVTGPGVLRGLENGDHANHENGLCGTKHAYKGRLLGYVQSTGVAGEVIVTVNSPGLSGDRTMIPAT